MGGQVISKVSNYLDYVSNSFDKYVLLNVPDAQNTLVNKITKNMEFTFQWVEMKSKQCT